MDRIEKCRNARFGMFILHVGPTSEGEIPSEVASRLRLIGDWMERNGESIFASGAGLPPGACYRPSTGSGDAINLHVLGRTGGHVLRVRGVGRQVVNATPLATGQALGYDQHPGHLEQGVLRVRLPDTLLEPHDTVVKLDLG